MSNCVLATRTGYYAPYSILGSALAAIGSGLLTTLVPNSPAAHWAGYAVIAGVGRGLAMMQTITAVQVVLPKEDLPVGNSFLLFTQSLGGALWVSSFRTSRSFLLLTKARISISPRSRYLNPTFFLNIPTWHLLT